jgi:hypothetical protein
LLDLTANIDGGHFCVGSGPHEPIPMSGWVVVSGFIDVYYFAPAGHTAPGMSRFGVNPNATVHLAVTFGP